MMLIRVCLALALMLTSIEWYKFVLHANGVEKWPRIC